ncbi:hypothetical protein IQ06DRAFT_301178 [Phaeosphaeriaceae sp. SRC1lsM3a]|nr:hypothetical protein IQ06DRAFT_301178 [Stagonospora sp. SRC1lsM3a]
MQFLTIASLFAAAAIAAPAPQTSDCPNPAHCGTPSDPSKYENVDITDYTLRKNDSGIQSISFKLSGQNATDILCEVSPFTGFPSKTVTCGSTDPDSGYRFIAIEPKGEGDADIAVYHQTAPFAGKWAEGSVPAYCHAGGLSPDDFICTQVNAYTIVLHQ